jgi:hypothetical protein
MLDYTVISNRVFEREKSIWQRKDSAKGDRPGEGVGFGTKQTGGR